MARVLIIDVGVQENISIVFERFRDLGKHIHGFGRFREHIHHTVIPSIDHLVKYCGLDFAIKAVFYRCSTLD